MFSRSSGGDPADDPEIHKADLARRHGKDITRMRVSMEEAIIKDLFKIGVDAYPCQAFPVEALPGDVCRYRRS